MTTPLWSPGEFINPGDLRQPRSGNPVVSSQLDNNDLEGAGGWTFSDAGLSIVTDARAYTGTKVIQHANTLFGEHGFTNNNIVPVVPGQSITATCFYLRETNVTGRQGLSLKILFYDASMVLCGTADSGGLNSGATNIWYGASVTGIAPADSAFAQLQVLSRNNNTGGPHAQLFDAFSWNYIQPTAQAGLVYKSVQANAGFTAATEPVWPLTVGLTVVDNEVTWEAVLASNVTWQAIPIMKSGSVEPTWPVEVGANVLDNTVNWLATDRRIQDEKCPNSKAVTIAASKIFAGDRDVIRFSATINPKDWTTADDAGYLPFGLQAYGSNDVAALGLYRSNLVGFNSQGFQMWQVDQDPANMAFLDAVPVGCTFPHSIQPVANDLLMLTAVGARNISIAGASTNLQADGVGEPVDKLVKAKIKALTSDDNALSLYWPAMGQYWIVFGDEAFVLTINAAKKKSWSRYVFPEDITDFTLDGNTLVLRAGDKVWEVDDETLLDDVPEPTTPLLVAICNNSGAAVATSSDGTTWTLRTTPGSTWTDVAYSPTLNRFVAVGVGNCVMTSSDAITWTAATLTGAWNAICWSVDLSIFVAVGDLGVIATSPDGITWTSRTSPNTVDYVAVKWIPALAIFVAGRDQDTAPHAATSPNGITWTNAITATFGMMSIAANGTNLVSVHTAYGGVETSVNGTTWAVVATAAGNATRVAYGNSRFALTSGTGQTAHSEDNGATWTIVNLSPSANAYGLCWSESLGLFVATTGMNDVANGVYTSPDGVTWTNHAVDVTFAFHNFDNVIAVDVPNPDAGVEFESIMQWPYLDMNAIGVEKMLVGLDLVCTAPTGVSVSIGYNQNDITQRTTDYEVSPDTLTGQMYPFPVSGPSFDMKLTFAAGQEWEWFAANLYVNDWRKGA